MGEEEVIADELDEEMDEEEPEETEEEKQARYNIAAKATTYSQKLRLRMQHMGPSCPCVAPVPTLLLGLQNPFFCTFAAS